MKSYREATLETLKRKKPVEKKVPILLDDTPQEELEEARKQLENAKSDKDKQEAQRSIEIAEQKIEENTVYFVFRAIGSKAYDTLIQEHQPTDEQKAANDGILWNPETFPRALIAATAYKPLLTLEQVDEIMAQWNGTEISDLFWAALAANTARRVVEAGKDS